jgi:hypothetical protein
VIVSPATLLDQFVHALGARDFAALESTFAPDIGFRALVPPGLREAHTRSEARQLYQRWFSDLQQFEMVGHTITPVGNRTHIGYRLLFTDEGVPKVNEQRIFVTTGPNGIEKLDLVCSGFLARQP